MNFAKIRSADSFNAYIAPEYRARMALEKFIANDNAENLSWYLYGFCNVCTMPTKFHLDWFNSYNDAEHGKMPSYRERIVCEHCNLNNRQRFMASYIARHVSEKSFRKKIYLYEQVTPFYKILVDKLKGIDIVGSEYFGTGLASGEMVGLIQHEDALKLSFPSESIDLICSNDVFEHVPDIDRALLEAFRVLKPEGRLVFSIPFQTQLNTSIQRARICGVNLDHILPATYHGNPLSKEGSLVFYDFGWDILGKVKDAGFSDCYMLCYYSLMYGHLGNGVQYTFVAKKT